MQNVYTHICQQVFSGLLMLFLFHTSLDAQRNCGMDIHNKSLLEDIHYANGHLERQSLFENYQISRNTPCDTIIILPVAVHFQNVNVTDMECLTGLVEEQIRILNEDFSALNPDWVNWLDNHMLFFSNVESRGSCISFCLADGNHPQGYDMEDGEPAITVNQFIGDDNVDFEGYVNVFVRNIPFLGYSPLGGVGDGDGITISWEAFSRGDGCGVVTPVQPFDKGRTLTHEMGHYLNLRHLWGDDENGEPIGCSSDDYLDDTPLQAHPYTGCPSGYPSSCESPDLHMNYMDYVDDACMYMFTAGQAERMETYALAVLGHVIAKQEIVCNVPLFPPEPAFDTDLTFACPGTAISFSDLSSGNPQSWDWSFPGGNPENSILQNPVVTYDSAGVFNVILSVTNENGTQTLVLNEYIEINHSAKREIYLEDFEGASDWSIWNPDNAVTWDIYTVNPGNNKVVGIGNHFYSAHGEKDQLISPSIDLSEYGGIRLEFDYAYARNELTEDTDTLNIYISENGGDTWFNVFSMTENGNGNFSTAPDMIGEFFPTSENDWCYSGDYGSGCFELDISSYDSIQDFKMMFENVCGYGNSLFIDNIRLHADCESFGTPTFPTVAFRMDTLEKDCGFIRLKLHDLTENSPTAWEWSFPGGVPPGSTGQNPVVEYQSPGHYDIGLVAFNEFGSDNFLLQDAIIIPELLEPDASASSVYVDISNSGQVQFFDNTIGASSWHWNFDDGTTSFEQNPLHTFTNEGTYHVSLIVSDGFCAKTVFITIEVFGTSVPVASPIAGIDAITSFPNPTRNILNIRASVQRPVDLEYILYNSIGMEIQGGRKWKLDNQAVESIDISSLSKGIYFLRITDGMNIQTIKFIKS